MEIRTLKIKQLIFALDSSKAIFFNENGENCRMYMYSNQYLLHNFYKDGENIVKYIKALNNLKKSALIFRKQSSNLIINKCKDLLGQLLMKENITPKKDCSKTKFILFKGAFPIC